MLKDIQKWWKMMEKCSFWHPYVFKFHCTSFWTCCSVKMFQRFRPQEVLNAFEDLLTSVRARYGELVQLAGAHLNLGPHRCHGNRDPGVPKRGRSHHCHLSLGTQSHRRCERKEMSGTNKLLSVYIYIYIIIHTICSWWSMSDYVYFSIST